MSKRDGARLCLVSSPFSHEIHGGVELHEGVLARSFLLRARASCIYVARRAARSLARPGFVEATLSADP